MSDCTTEIKQVQPSDLAKLHLIDIKCHPFPLSKEKINELISSTKNYGVAAIYAFQTSGFAFFEVQKQGELLAIQRFSVASWYIDKGVPEKLITNLQTTLGGDVKPELQLTISENDIESPLFAKLKEIGFCGCGVDKNRFYEYGDWCDGIKMSLT